MKRRYQVKFTVQGKTHFGVIDHYSDKAKQAAKEGCLLVSDAIGPQRYKVKDDADVVDIPYTSEGMGKYNSKTGEFEGGDEFHVAVRDAFKEAEKIDAALPDGGQVHVGSLFSIGVADGQAWYVVTKVNKKTCEVEWRGFGGGDRYTDHHFGWGGKFSLTDVVRYVSRTHQLAKMFGKRRKG